MMLSSEYRKNIHVFLWNDYFIFFIFLKLMESNKKKCLPQKRYIFASESSSLICWKVEHNLLWMIILTHLYFLHNVKRSFKCNRFPSWQDGIEVQHQIRISCKYNFHPGNYMLQITENLMINSRDQYHKTYIKIESGRRNFSFGIKGEKDINDYYQLTI